MIPATRPGLDPAAGNPAAGVVASKAPLVVTPGELTADGTVVPAGDGYDPSPQPASGVPADGSGDAVPAGTVQSELDYLAGALPPPPPEVGRAAPPWTPATGIPDWGSLKLADPADGRPERYPSYVVPPGPAVDPRPFPRPGQDPGTDWVWNSGVNPVALPGAGSGLARSAGVPAGAGPVARTLRVVRRGPDPARPGSSLEYVPVTVSGIVSPADRGVLALCRWAPSNADGTPAGAAEFLAQPLADRVIAALLLGQGILPPPPPAGKPPKPRNCSGCDEACDGDSGGIFGPGAGDDGTYDPLSFPGRASGQYDLREILRGVDDLDGLPLRPPFDDLDGNGVRGAQRALGGPRPGAGQVRLGTDSGAGPVLPYGIPILGASVSGYSPVPPVDPTGMVLVGDSVVLTAGGQEPNFFAYRLPQLSDYAALPYTPRGMAERASRETFRFFRRKPLTAATYPDGSPVGVELPTAGLYGGLFRQDGWSRQVARFRHSFLLRAPGTGLARLGSCLLLHFRTEGAFEKFALQGVVDPADLYGAQVADPKHLGAEDNVANADTAAQRSPRGPAPAYGYAARSYHLLRAEVTVPAEVAAPTATGTATWSAEANPPVNWVSGVAYFVPLDYGTGASSLTISSVGLSMTGAWAARVFGVDDARLTGRSAPPALVASPCPVVISVAAFGWGEHPTQPGQPSIDVPVGPFPPMDLTDFAGSAAEPRLRRVEVPLTHCGQNGQGAFGDGNAPDAADTLAAGTTTTMSLRGDDPDPSFSTDARLRAFFRSRHDGGLWPDDRGVELTLNPAAQLMLHTARNTGAGLPRWGNVAVGVFAPLVVPPTLCSPGKDREERFLDESYRATSNFGQADALSGPGAGRAVSGPGLGSWRGGFVPVPARLAVEPGWDASSWLCQGLHLSPLQPGALQVAGLPHRSPTSIEGAAYPHPSAGILRYPADNYGAAGVRPSQADDALAFPQPDYSAAAGLRAYARVLDLGPGYSGRSVVALRVDGLDLSDLRYQPPGPGRAGQLCVQVKVPGMTTWMDVGRRDGDGPSKQSPTEDGAGCLVLGPGTTEGVDPVSGLVYCRLELHLGPQASAQPSGFGAEVPLLVRVLMSPDATPYDLLHLKNPITGLFGPPSPFTPNLYVRGIVGVRVEEPS